MISTGNFAMATAQNYELQNQKFSVDLQDGWKGVENIAGNPLVIFGPENKESGNRTVMLFTPTGVEDSKNFFSGAKGNSEKYKDGREDWLKENEGKALSYDPYQEEKWTGVEKAHFFGFHYELDTGNFYERSVYLLCGGNKIFHVKSLVAAEDETKHNAIVDQTIKSLKCEKTAQKKQKI